MPSPLDAGGLRPEERESLGTPAPNSPEEALRRLEQRLDRATDAAERLMAEVAAEAARAAAVTGAPRTARAGSPPAGNSAVAGEPAAEPGSPGAGAAAPSDPPPAGWQTAGDARDATSELDPLVALVQAMRDLIPPELQQRLIAALREMLMAFRALIDWYLERIENRGEQGPEIQDIPIQ
jgi:hypothetical protein